MSSVLHRPGLIDYRHRLTGRTIEFLREIRLDLSMSCFELGKGSNPYRRDKIKLVAVEAEIIRRRRRA